MALGAVLALAGCGGGGDDGSAPRSTPPSSTTTGPADTATTTGPADTATTTGRGARRPVPGFGEIAFKVTTASGEERCGCALLAHTPDRRARGLMRQRDLSGYDGMLFVFSTDSSLPFHMRDTPLPLTIAWFASDGDFVSATDMDPCLGRDDCPTYSAAAPYRLALEVARGGLADLGVGPGARLTVESTPCPG